MQLGQYWSRSRYSVDTAVLSSKSQTDRGHSIFILYEHQYELDYRLQFATGTVVDIAIISLSSQFPPHLT